MDRKGRGRLHKALHEGGIIDKGSGLDRVDVSDPGERGDIPLVTVYGPYPAATIIGCLATAGHIMGVEGYQLNVEGPHFDLGTAKVNEQRAGDEWAVERIYTAIHFIDLDAQRPGQQDSDTTEY